MTQERLNNTNTVSLTTVSTIK